MRKCIGLLIFGVFAAPALLPADIRWQANGTPACLAADNQMQPQVAPDGQGGLFAAWRDDRGTLPKIYAQRIDAAGTAQWGSGRLAALGGGAQDYPLLAALPGGRALVVWEDDRNGTVDLFFQVLDAGGQRLLEASGRTLCAAAGDQVQACLAQEGTGYTYVVWCDTRATIPAVYGQRLDASGTAQWGAGGRALAADTQGRSLPAAAAGTATGLVVAWLRVSGGYSELDINRYHADGAPAWGAPGVVVSSGPGDSFNPRLCVDAAGRTYIGWEETRSGNGNIRMQWFDLQGRRQFDEAQELICGDDGEQGGLELASLADGIVALVWNDQRLGLVTNAYYQIVEADGTLKNPANGAVLAAEAHGQHSLKLSGNGDGRMYCVWSTGPYISAFSDIRLQSFHADGHLDFGLNGQAVCTSVNAQDFPSLAPTGDGGVFIVWMDIRNWVDGDVFAQRFDKPTPWIGSVAPAVMGNTGTAAVRVTGRYLDSASSAGFCQSGTTLTALALTVEGEYGLTAEMNLMGRPEQPWTCWVTDNVGQTGFSDTAVQVIWPRALSMTGREQVTSSLLAGQKNRPVWGASITSQGWDRLQALSIRNLGTAEAVRDIAAVKLWLQPDGGNFDLATAQLIDSLQTSGGPRIWSGTVQENYPWFTSDAAVYVTLDIAGSPQAGSVCQLSVEPGAWTFGSGRILPSAALINPQQQIILLSTETLRLGLENRMPAKANPGQAEITAARVTVQNTSASPIPIVSLTIHCFDTQDQPVSAAGLVETLRMRGTDGTEFGSGGNFSSLDPAIVLFLPAPVRLDPQETWEAELIFDLVSNPRLAAFKLGIADPYAVDQGDYKALLWQGRMPLTSNAVTVFRGGSELSLSNYPNPFRRFQGTAISYYLPANGTATLAVWTLTGEKVADLLEAAARTPGLHTDLRWDGRNGAGQAVRSGVYMIRMTAVLENGRILQTSRKAALLP